MARSTATITLTNITFKLKLFYLSDTEITARFSFFRKVGGGGEIRYQKSSKVDLLANPNSI